MTNKMGKFILHKWTTARIQAETKYQPMIAVNYLVEFLDQVLKVPISWETVFLVLFTLEFV